MLSKLRAPEKLANQTCSPSLKGTTYPPSKRVLFRTTPPFPVVTYLPLSCGFPFRYPDSTLINGRGRYKDGPAVPLTVISVVPTKRSVCQHICHRLATDHFVLSYRVRLISMACDPHFLFQIDGHTMTIIEVDGINHKPYQVDSIDILAGE